MASKKTILKLVFAAFLIAFTAVAVYFTGEYFKGQLFLAKEGLDLFPASDIKKPNPVFRAGDSKTCNKKITLQFQLDNKKYINQLSLEKLIVKDESGKVLPVSLESDPNKTVLLLKEGDKKGVNVNPGPLKVGEKEAVYVKEATGYTFLVCEGKYEFLNNGILFATGENDEEIYTNQVITNELKSDDGKNKLLTALPDFYTERTGGKEFAEFIFKMAKEKSDKIAKRLNSEPAPWYIITASQYLIPDNVRAGKYTASGMAYNISGNIAPKYSLNFELIFKNCAAQGDFTKFKCWDNKATLDSLNYTLAHELSHIYEFGSKNNLTNGTALLEGLAELNALTLDSPNLDKAAWARFNSKYKQTDNCKSITDVYKQGGCFLQYFKDEITDSNFKNLFSLKKTYDFGKDVCGSWFAVMQEVTGKPLENMKETFKTKICI